jgi:hypothetical protein
MLRTCIYTPSSRYAYGVWPQRTLSLEIDTGQDLGEREHHSKLKRDNHIFDYCLKVLQ